MRDGESIALAVTLGREGFFMPPIEIRSQSPPGTNACRRAILRFRASLRQAALLVIAVAMGVAAGETPSFGQYVNRRSSYEQRLLRGLDTSTASRPEDLPELSRLLLLEAISMREHVRRELRGTLAGVRLLEKSDAVLQAATVFDDVAAAMAAGEPLGATPQAALADLEGATAEVRADLGAVPGIARLAAFRLDRVTSLLGEIRPRVGSAAPVAAANTSRDVREEFRPAARLLVEQLDDLLGLLPSSDLRPGVEQLRALANGFERLLTGRPSLDDLQAAFRPVRLQALPVNAFVLSRAVPVEVRTRWRAIQDGIDRLSERFGFPRVIVLTTASPTPRPPSPEAIARIDSAVAEIEAFLAEIAPDPVLLPDKVRVEDEAQHLRTLLLRYRQNLLAGLSTPQLPPTPGDLVGVSRQLAARVQTSLARRQGLDFPRIRGIERLVNELGQEPPAR
jgi:hypothetical protein